MRINIVRPQMEGASVKKHILREGYGLWTSNTHSLLCIHIIYRERERDEKALRSSLNRKSVQASRLQIRVFTNTGTQCNGRVYIYCACSEYNALVETDLYNLT